MANSHTPELPTDFVESITSFLERPHNDWSDESVMSTIHKILADEIIWGTYHIDVSALDPGFVLDYDSSSRDYELVHDEKDICFFEGISYKLPLVTITPVEVKEPGWDIDLLLHCVSILRHGNYNGFWWGHYRSPPLRSHPGDYLAFMFVFSRGGKKEKYLFPPSKVMRFHTTSAGEYFWIGVNVPQDRAFAKHREEAAKYEREYNDCIESGARCTAEKCDLICRVEAWLESLEIHGGQKGGRRRGRRGGRGRGRGKGRHVANVDDDNDDGREETDCARERKGGQQRDSKAATGSKPEQPVPRQILKRNPSPVKTVVVRQILKRTEVP